MCFTKTLQIGAYFPFTPISEPYSDLSEPVKALTLRPCCDTASVLKIIYLTNPLVYYSGCGVKNIDCQTDDGQYYVGTVNTTKEGYECQNWDKSKGTDNQKRVGGKDNYCRNPTPNPKTGNGAGAWCYTKDNNEHEWAYCPIRKCAECDMGKHIST